ncbi:putative glutathione S-transferase [Roseovarius nanhaiticus]|uniref:Putative glutathione S-transferase n=1 Tax=Roseovarius nanhaiticus TaxID=573024 RepID=A0A1N7FSG1_9RHOB|nr:glutathione S-transferase family protein [Roseovarius nanhaiticus]SEK46684.1 putative glutathione S-transferase [Roseovarius nanhaiticus]SIS03260.1 putative glutathione S-transferase [Roseovarius nanhaiticus]
MGLLIDGEWHDKWYDTDSTGGKFERSEAQFRNWVTADGSAGPTGQGGFKAEAGRYHLYVSLACPWANRTLILRSLKGLKDAIGLSVVNPYMGAHGWTFQPGPGVIADPGGADYMYQVYLRADPNYSGRVTVPVLWDKERETIVSNESADIIRMLNSAFAEIATDDTDYSPDELMGEIDEINALTYDAVNNGVHKAGFATDQKVYEGEVKKLFDALDTLEDRLGKQRYLVGDRLTEADWRLFTTLIRFDPVYHGHFKCNLKMLKDYNNLWSYTRELYQIPGVAETVDFDHIQQHYYRSHGTINPNGIVPAGPVLDYQQPSTRGF